MALSETVDSLPMFKNALNELHDRYKGHANIEDVVKSVVAFSKTLNRQADASKLQDVTEKLECLLDVMETLSLGNSSMKTGVLGADHFGNDSMKTYFDDLFTKLSASLPNIFVTDGGERNDAADETEEHLKEVSRFADIQGNQHVVGLCDAMILVVQFHKDSSARGTAGNETASLVKPLLRGFALLRTAFDSPDEPNLSPALIDATANLRDLIGDCSEECSIGLDYSGMHSSLADETVCSDGSQDKRAEEPPEVRKTMAFPSVRALIPPSKLDGVRALVVGDNKAAASIEKALDPFVRQIPIDITHASDISSFRQELVGIVPQLVICDADMNEGLRNCVVEHFKGKKGRILLVAKVSDEIEWYMAGTSHNPVSFSVSNLKPKFLPDIFKQLNA